MLTRFRDPILLRPLTPRCFSVVGREESFRKEKEVYDEFTLRRHSDKREEVSVTFNYREGGNTVKKIGRQS